MSAVIVSNVLKHSKQKSTKRLLMVILAGESDQNGIACFDDGTLVEQANLTPGDLPDLLDSLFESGELHIHRHEDSVGVYVVTPGLTEPELEHALKRVNRQFPLKVPLPERQAHPGYIYVLHSTTGYYKIGRTKEPDDRLRTFEVKLPFEIEYEHLIAVEDMIRAEKFLHDRFADKRVRGEWFALNEEDLAEIKLWDGES